MAREEPRAALGRQKHVLKGANHRGLIKSLHNETRFYQGRRSKYIVYPTQYYYI